MNLYAVVTTIQAPTDSMRSLVARWEGKQGSLIVVGDRKGPFEYSLEGTRLVSIDQQHGLEFSLARILPERHYARKNLGYLIAIAEGAEVLYETDDDNAPLGNWKPRSLGCESHRWSQEAWVNVYTWFTDLNIWPRGLGLDSIHCADKGSVSVESTWMESPIQQGLANGSPDVDAIWRLVSDQEVRFREEPSVRMAPGAWCPFNSQSTWWWPEAYALMYLPSLVPFRMTDIWRSFVAQRCLWAMGRELVFHGAEVYQLRNPHEPYEDFRDEVSGYLKNPEIRDVLESLDLRRGAGHSSENLLVCYEALIRRGIIPQGELPLVEAWVADIQALVAGKGTGVQLGTGFAG